MPKRCGWVKMNNPLYVAYHDEEWGHPLHDDQALFELLCMETYQAGLSWETVLNKRQAFREAFYGYQIQAVAEMTDTELEALMDTIDSTIPIVYNLNVGHATPRAIVPFGVHAYVDATDQVIRFDYNK